MQRRKEGWTREIKSNRNLPPPSSSRVPSVFRPVSVPRAPPDMYNTLPSSVQDTCKYLAITDMTTRQSDVASDFLYIAPPPIYGFVIEKEFPATLFSSFFPSSPSDSRRLYLPLPGGSICGDFNPWQTAFRFKDGHPTSIPSSSSSLPFSSRMLVRGVGDVITRRVRSCVRARVMNVVRVYL